MNAEDATYTRYALVREMLDTVDLVRYFPIERIGELPVPRTDAAAPFLVGEGSSRIFPADHAVAAALRRGDTVAPRTESAHEAAALELAGRMVYVASNSGKTAECVHLIRHLRERGHEGGIVGIAGAADAPVAAESDDAYVLTCGAEQAVAATKSVVEQALVYDLLFRRVAGVAAPDLGALAGDIDAALTTAIPADIVRRIAGAPTVYFAGRTDGVAAELALKANEIVRARSDFLPGTYAVHGIEEVMDPRDVLIWIDPPVEYEGKFREVLADGVGLSIIAISARETSFPTIGIPAPAAADTAAYLELAAGWNLLVEAGIALGIDVDKPERARKVGNEFSEGAG
jgi:glucosamine--fructose-6-phosphate aminotransferase (isomerizing)